MVRAGHIVALAVLVLGATRSTALADSQAPSPDHLIHYRARAMGTIVDVSIWGDDEASAAQAAQEVFKEFERIDKLMSSWTEDSALAKINGAAGGAPVKVDAEVFKVLEAALAGSRTTRGAFDVTVGAFRGLWKFDQDRDGTIPNPEEIEPRRKLVNYRDVIINRKANTVKLRRAGQRIILGGAAKGYAVDRAVEILHERGFVDFIIQAGGDLYVSGRRGDRSWRVGIRDPRGRRDASFAIAEIQDRTFSTSGDYERYVVEDDVRYHHILDPKTGRPATASRSVTVMAKSALQADIWSTALFVLGAKEGVALVEKRPDLEAVFVTADNQVITTSGLKDRIVIIKPPSEGI